MCWLIDCGDLGRHRLGDSSTGQECPIAIVPGWRYVELCRAEYGLDIAGSPRLDKQLIGPVNRAADRQEGIVEDEPLYLNAALYDFSCPAPTRRMAATVMTHPSGPSPNVRMPTK
jgi:hypothetical protein